MSRHEYCDELDPQDLAMWRGRVMSAIRGKRGQKLLRDLATALDAMPTKKLFAGIVQAEEGVCALGCVGTFRGLDFTKIDHEEDAEYANEELAAELREIY